MILCVQEERYIAEELRARLDELEGDKMLRKDSDVNTSTDSNHPQSVIEHLKAGML